MSQASEFVDPRSDVSHPLEEGQVYEDSRDGEDLTLVYLSDSCALMRDEASGWHRLERRDQFEANVGSNRYKLQGDASGEAVSGAASALRDLIEKYDADSGRKSAHKVEALREAIDLIENNGRPDDNDVIPLEDIDGIGTAAAKALRADGFTTKGDVRAVDRETIEEVPYMGEKNTSNLLEYIE